MKARPIIFSAPMIRALLDGRKTMTRRVVNIKHMPYPYRLKDGDTPFCEHTWPARRIGMHCPDCASAYRKACPYGQQGDLLWCRETFLEHSAGDPIYRADNAFDDDDAAIHGGWRPCIHMPRRYSRLTLALTDVRVERVQDISEEDAEAEGIEFNGDQPSPRDEFSSLWDSIHGPGAWSLNQWVWSLRFRVIHANVDAVLAEHAEYGVEYVG